MECPHDHEAISMSTRILRVGFDKGVGGVLFSMFSSHHWCIAVFWSTWRKLEKNWRESVLWICHFFYFRLLHYRFVAETVRGKQVGDVGRHDT